MSQSQEATRAELHSGVRELFVLCRVTALPNLPGCVTDGKVPLSCVPTALITAKGSKEKEGLPEREKLVLSNYLP